MSVSSKELESRHEVLDDLDDYINKCQEDITAMLDTLEWTPEHFMQPRKLSACQYISAHKMPISALDKHEKTCDLRSQGYSKEDVEQILEDTSYFYKNADCVHSIKLDKEKLNSVLWKHHVENHSVFYGLERMPRTPVEEEQLLSREDRLGLAQYITATAKEANRLKDLEKSELLGGDGILDLMRKGGDKDVKLNPLEEIAALRDYRRRRQTYRAKNVHITKKSHTEVLREVITNQMEMLEKSLGGDLDRHDTDESLQERRNDKFDPRERRPTHKSRSRSREKHERSSSRSRNETERRSNQRNDTEGSSRSRPGNETASSSRSRQGNETETSSRSRQGNETASSSRSRQGNEAESSSRSRQGNETASSSRSRQGNETENSSRARPGNETASGSRSRQGNETASSSRSRQENETENSSSSRQGNETASGSRSRHVDETESGSRLRLVDETESSSRSRHVDETESSSRSRQSTETRSDSRREDYRSRSRSKDRLVVRRGTPDGDRSNSKSPSKGSDRSKKHKHKKHKKHKHKHKHAYKDDDVP